MKDSESTILIVEDDPNDVLFLKRAFKRSGVLNPIQSVGDGEEAVAYLAGSGKFADRVAFPFPRVILTDLKMPRMNGIELLKWLYARPEMRVVPIIVLTSSTDEDDIKAAFCNGASAYMVKPVAFDELERVVKVIADYWRLSLVPRPGAC